MNSPFFEKVLLVTHNYERVAEIEIPKFQSPVPVIVWWSRTFMFDNPENDIPREVDHIIQYGGYMYVECFAYYVPPARQCLINTPELSGL